VFSGHSNALTASTLSGAPSAPPVPTNLRLRDADDALTDTQIRLVWNASPGATRYYLYQNGVRLNISDLDTTAVILRNRAPNTNFTFTVRAAGASGVLEHLGTGLEGESVKNREGIALVKSGISNIQPFLAAGSMLTPTTPITRT